MDGKLVQKTFLDELMKKAPLTKPVEPSKVRKGLGEVGTDVRSLLKKMGIEPKE